MPSLLSKEEASQQLFWAAEDNNLHTAQTLLTQCVPLDDFQPEMDATPIDINWVHKQHTPLTISSEKGHLEMVLLLMEHGADVRKRTEYGWPPFHLACRKGHLKVVQALAQKYPDCIFERALYEWSPLQTASQNGHLPVVEWLIATFGKKVLVNDVTIDNCTALMRASSRGFSKIVQLLVDNGADVNIINNQHKTALMLASEYGHDEVIVILLAVNPDPDYRPQKTYNLHSDLYKGRDQFEISREVIAEGERKRKFKPEDCWTALMFAASEGKTKSVELLKSRGADVNACAKNGSRPLLIALYRNHEETARRLIELGAQVQIEDTDKNTPLSLAQKLGLKDLEALIQTQLASTPAQ